jgi:alanine dehydrogenase
MKIGVPREIKNQEHRVAITPAGVRETVKSGHRVFIESGAGLGSSISDLEFLQAGATILDSADQLWEESDLILKVKEPIAAEYARMRRGQILFAYLHLAASRECTEALIASGITAIAYETVEVDKQLPLLSPMSEIAGRMATQVGAATLQKSAGGRGVLLGGIPGVRPAKVVILGGGTAGIAAATIADGMRADVTILDISYERLALIDQIFSGRVGTLISSSQTIEEELLGADLVIGAVLVRGARAPKLVTHDLVERMKAGSVLVDIAIDQGGCFEDSRPTTHTDPTFQVGEVLFYCVTNMPGAVPFTATSALSNVTLPYLLALANFGLRGAIERDPSLALGVNIHDGKIFSPAVGQAHGLKYETTPIEKWTI